MVMGDETVRDYLIARLLKIRPKSCLLYTSQWDYGGGGNVQREFDGERAVAGGGTVDGELADSGDADGGGGGGDIGAGDFE